MTLQKSILHFRTFCPGVFFCKNCGTINKEDSTYKILLSSDYQEVFVYVSEGSSGNTYERLHSICVYLRRNRLILQ